MDYVKSFFEEFPYTTKLIVLMTKLTIWIRPTVVEGFGLMPLYAQWTL